MGWVDDKLKNPTGPQVMPHPGDPGYSLKEIAERAKKGYKKPAAAAPPSTSEQRSDTSRQALRDAVSTPVADTSNLPVIDPLGDLNEIYKQLLNNLGSMPTVMSDKKIRQLAMDQIKMQFDPQIKALKGEMAERKKRYAANKAEVKDLYSDLANQYRSERTNSANGYSDALNQNAQREQAFNETTQQNYDNSLESMTDEFSKLGIGDVAQVAYPEQQQDLQYQQTLNAAENDAFDRYLSAQQSSSNDLYSKMAANAGYHGAETIEDLLSELNTSLDSTSGQISTLNSQKSTGLSSLIAQLQQQQQERIAKAQQERFQNLLASGGFGMDIAKLQQSMQQASAQNQQKVPTSGLLGANQILASGSDPTKLSGAFQQLLQQQEFREGRFKAADGTIVKLSGPQAAQYAAQMAQQMGLSPQDTTALVNAMYAYFGQLGR